MWTAIHAIGATAERRVWSDLNGLKLHPNLFLFLVGPPGVGKSVAINPVSEILRRSQTVFIAPTDMTKQGLLDTLITASKGAIIDGMPMDYNFMCICISELSNFMSQYDGALAGLLTDLFDCPPILEEKKRGVPGASKTIPFPGISFVMGTATQNLGATITDEMWGSGFMARVIMIYSDQIIRPNSAKAMFTKPEKREDIGNELDSALRRLGELKGEMLWDFAAQTAIWEFWTQDDAQAPVHNRLANYNTRRWMHLAKLCMISAMSDERMVVLKSDFTRALGWLRDAEVDMPEIFKGMVSHEDGKVFEDLQHDMWMQYMKDRQPFALSWLYMFFSSRVSSFAIPRMVEVAEAAGFIQRMAGTSGDDVMFIPGAMTTARNRGVM